MSAARRALIYQEVPIFNTWEANWERKICPVCKAKSATSHAWLYMEAPPKLGLSDRRSPKDEVFLHDDGTECLLSATQI
jgi:hypothetical protein